jgi:hypothetical protein
MNLVDSKPKDLAHEIRQFANRTAMLRECGLRHIGDMLVAMLIYTPSDSEHAPSAAAELAGAACAPSVQDPTALTIEEASAIGHILAVRTRSSHVPSSALREVLNLNSVLCAMKTEHAWFAPMLEALVAQQEAVEAEGLVAWLDDVEDDAKHRENRIAAMESTSGLVYSKAVPLRVKNEPRECSHRGLDAMPEMMNDYPILPSKPAAPAVANFSELMQKAMDMFLIFERSSAGVKQLKRSATLMFSEIKLDEETGLLLGRTAGMVRATPQEICAYNLNYDSRHVRSITNPAVWVRAEVLQHIDAHHTIIFNRGKLPGISDRTFLNVIAAERMEDDPLTYMLVGFPLAHHDDITPKDEVGAVRAENCRAFRLTEVSPGVTKVDTLPWP